MMITSHDPALSKREVPTSEHLSELPALPSFARQPGDRVSAQFLGFSGVAGFLCSFWLASHLGLTDAALLIALFLAGTGFPLIAVSLFVLKVHLRPSTGIRPEPQRPLDWHRIGTKLLGFGFTLGCLGLIYWVIPEYGKAFYAPVWDMLSWAACPLGIVAVAYFVWMDQRMADPRDMYWQIGRMLLGMRPAIEPDAAKQYILGWIVKGFFLPLMLAGAAENLPSLVRDGISFETFALLYTSAVVFIYSLDVTYGALGYLLTLRVLDSHIRSTEPTATGWISAIICYAPFAPFVWGTFLKYKGEIQWNEWLAGMPVLYVTWGCAILFLLVIYVWATVSFGCRFSNLTNRGIITDGPYRLVRHPAYLAKNLAWWLMYVPFAAHADWQSAIKGCICLLLTTLIYVIRSRTEERHLLTDPAYRAYYHWVEQNGLMAQVRSVIPTKWRRDATVP